jgi:hypothetical protein
MPTETADRTNAVLRKSAEIAWASPQVVALRTLQMMTADWPPSPRDQSEFARMGSEKVDAFQASWQAMSEQAARTHAALAADWWRCTAWPWQAIDVGALQNAALAILDQGIAPVHAEATGNLQRLSRRK